MIRRILALIWATAAMIAVAVAQQTPVHKVTVQTRPIPFFEIGHTTRQFGSLEYIGGLDLSSSAWAFGSLSAVRFRKPGSDFVGVSDNGFWVFGAVDRDADGVPIGISNFTLQQFVDKNGAAVKLKTEADAEGLAIKGDTATIGFERDHRISQFRIDPSDMRGPLRDLDFLVPRNELRQNRGFEAVAYAPDAGPLKGALVIVSEKSLDPKGNVFAAVLDGPRKGIFTVAKNNRYDITDSAFLPNGDLLLLERSFSMSTGVGMRLRRIPGDAIKGGADSVDGPVLLEAGMAYQIDNMEAMDVWQRGDGATMISLFSDDNGSIFQRTVYLEFKLTP